MDKKQELVNVLKETQKQQNAVAKEVLDYLKSKMPELYYLSEKNDNLQNELFDLIGDDIPNYYSKEWNELYDMTDGLVLGYNIDRDYRQKMINNKTSYNSCCNNG